MIIHNLTKTDKQVRKSLLKEKIEQHKKTIKQLKKMLKQ